MPIIFLMLHLCWMRPVGVSGQVELHVLGAVAPEEVGDLGPRVSCCSCASHVRLLQALDPPAQALLRS